MYIIYIYACNFVTNSGSWCVFVVTASWPGMPLRVRVTMCACKCVFVCVCLCVYTCVYRDSLLLYSIPKTHLHITLPFFLSHTGSNLPVSVCCVCSHTNATITNNKRVSNATDAIFLQKATVKAIIILKLDTVAHKHKNHKHTYI